MQNLKSKKLDRQNDAVEILSYFRKAPVTNSLRRVSRSRRGMKVYVERKFDQSPFILRPKVRGSVPLYFMKSNLTVEIARIFVCPQNASTALSMMYGSNAPIIQTNGDLLAG